MIAPLYMGAGLRLELKEGVEEEVVEEGEGYSPLSPVTLTVPPPSPQTPDCKNKPILNWLYSIILNKI